jgi:hypothetical protein
METVFLLRLTTISTRKEHSRQANSAYLTYLADTIAEKLAQQNQQHLLLSPPAS